MIKYLLSLTTILMSFSANSQVIQFTDANLKAKLLVYGSAFYINSSGNYAALILDGNFDGEITVAEAEEAVGLYLDGGEITSLLDLQYFTNVQTIGISNNELLVNFVLPDLPLLDALHCSHNNLSSIDLSNIPTLEVLDCGYNALTSLDTSLNPMLTSVNCQFNQIASVNFTFNPLLTSIQCGHNELAVLDITGLDDLTSLICYNNNLSEIDLSDQNLTTLECGDNSITSLELAGQTNLQTLRCQYNLLETLDLSFRDIPTVACNNNSLLRFLFVKNGGTDSINISGCPLLEYICADDSDISMLYSTIDFEAINCVINSYCTFTPGGEYYWAEGNVRFDANSDGCSITDTGMPFQRLSISGPGGISTRYAHQNGQLSIAIPANQQLTITPEFENNYFISSPTSLMTAVPTGDDPFPVNFCVLANGVHPDLEIWIIPETAVPGFNTNYKIVYKNKGTHPQSDAITFLYEENHLDFISSTETPSSISTGALSWNFTNLQPFEMRSFDITMKVNAPTDTPPVINGQELAFTAVINPVTGDETMTDNSFALTQTTVGSFDPNDITCLEGDVIAPAMVGEFVHYVIRFENTGTYAAANVVVRDLIDMSKFDINSLIPISGSHTFETRISSGNRVEFIFENINLPFDDTTNDGYIAFKIKTKPDLVVGDTFTNTAAIYFDYNSPIVTNTETTAITALSNPDFDFNEFITLYPNPATQSLNIASTNAIAIKSIGVYNMLGQQLIAIPNAQDVFQLDIGTLTPGTYFVKIDSDKGILAAKFIKK